MTITPQTFSTTSPRLPNGEQTLRIAAAAYLSRFRALSRTHAESDLRAFLTWCAERQLDPLTASRPQVELYVRWMQEIRRLKPSTRSRRMSIVAGFYRTAVIDGLIERPPRHPRPRQGQQTVLVPLPPAVGRALDQAIGDRTGGPILLNTRGARMDRHAATRRLRALAAATGMRMPTIHPHMLRHTYVTTMLDAGVDLRDVQIAARHADPRITMRYDRARNHLDRHPNYILAAYMASGT